MAVCCTHWLAVRRHPEVAHRRARADELQPCDLLPQHGRWCSLPRLPLIDDSFASGADASGQAVLCESEPTTKIPQLTVVVVRDRWQGRRAGLLPAEPAVVRGHELLGGGAGGQTPGPTKHGLHGEVGRKSSRSDGGLQCADVDVEFLGQPAERQQLRLVRMMFNRRPSPQEHGDRHRAQPAVPHAKRVHGDVEQPGTVALREIRVPTQLAKLVHAQHTMPSAAPVVKRPPAYLAGDQQPCRHGFGASPKSPRCKMLSKAVDDEIAQCGRELARLITLFDVCSPASILAIEIGEFFRNWRARQDSNLRPPA